MQIIPRIQIAGIKDIAEAEMAMAAGADGIGLLQMLDYARGDAITKEQAQEIVKYVGDQATTVMITHSTDIDAVSAWAKELKCHTVQVHNDSEVEMSASELKRLRQELKTGIIKVLHVPAEATEAAAEQLFKKARELAFYADAFILDTKAMEEINGEMVQTLGGTGKLNDWDMCRLITQASPIPVIMAGGLTVDNVADAITHIKPYAVDVNSGTRKSDSVEKDAGKVRGFVVNAEHGFKRV